MLTNSRTVILLLGLALLSGISHADDFMLGGNAPGAAVLAQSRQDCDIQAGNAAQARVIYHDGQRAPVSVPMDGAIVGEESAAVEAAPAATGTAAATAAPLALPSAEPAIPQKPRGGGLRWQSVLPGSIK